MRSEEWTAGAGSSRSPEAALRKAPEDRGNDEVREGGARSHLRVCLGTPIFSPDYSGAALRFQRYAPGLRARGVRLEVVTPVPGGWKANRRYVGQERITGRASDIGEDVPVHRVPVAPGTPKWRTRHLYESAVFARCAREETRPDLVLWLGLAVHSAWNLSRIRRLGIPSIYVQTIVKDLSGSGWKQRIRRLYWPLRYRFVDQILVGSGAMREHLRELGVGTGIEAIPHGVDLTRFHPPSPSAPSPVRGRLNLEPADELVLFMGPIRPRKGVDSLAEAWHRVARGRPRAHLVLVGPERAEDGSRGPSFKEGVEATLGNGPGAERVHFVGAVEDPEEYFRAADLFVFPSHREGMPNVVGEALASGLPCVLTPFLGLPEEFGRPGEQYVLVDHDPSRLAGSISGLLADPARRRKLGEAAHRWSEEHLDLEKILDRLAEYLREMAACGNGGRVSEPTVDSPAEGRGSDP